MPPRSGRVTKSARARTALLEIFRKGGEHTVRDLKELLRARGIDLEATAQRIYDLRRAEHGGHPIRHRIITRGDRRLHVYFLDGVARTDAGKPRSDSPSSFDAMLTDWVRERLAEGDRAAIDRAEPAVRRIAAEIEAESHAGPERRLVSDALLSTPPGERLPARRHPSPVDMPSGGLPTGDRD